MLPGSAKKTSRQREASPSPVQEELAAAAKKPEPEPVTVNLMEPGRPYRAFVESSLRRYLRDNNIRSLVKPAREEIRAAAMRILVQGLRRRSGSTAYVDPTLANRAIADVVQHAREQGWIGPRSRSETRAGPFYVKVLIQLVEDAHWMPIEIPLPPHPAPHHPPVYFYHEMSKWGDYYPVARPDSLIRGDYVLDMDGRRITDDEYIHPWPYPHRRPDISGLIDQQRDACYVLKHRGPSVWVEMYWLETFRYGMQMEKANLENLQFGKTATEFDNAGDFFSLVPTENSSAADDPCNAFVRRCLSALSRQAGLALRYFPALRRIVLDDPAH